MKAVDRDSAGFRVSDVGAAGAKSSAERRGELWGGRESERKTRGNLNRFQIRFSQRNTLLTILSFLVSLFMFS